MTFKVSRSPGYVAGQQLKITALPSVITYTVGSGGTGGTGATNGSSGSTSTLTFFGDTLTASGGSGGEYNNNVDATGGGASGGDTNSTGGTGQGSSGDTGAGGGGGIGGANAVEGNSGAGDAGAQSNDIIDLFATLVSLSVATSSAGSGGTGGANPNIDHGGNATGFGCGGGGAGWYGGNGGNGLYGGGGGGASGYSATQNGGVGGSGAVVLSFTGGTPSAVLLTSGTTYTVPAGTTQVKAWVVGAGGGGAGSPATDGASGGGGGAGGVAAKTWSLGSGIVSGRFLSKSGAPSIITSGLVLHLDAGNAASYPGTGTTWTDLSGQGNNATLTNGPTFDSANGGSIVFDGSNDYAPTTTTSFPFGSAAGTISGWAKATSIGGGTSWIFAYGNAAQSQSRFIGRLGSTFYAGGYNDDITYSSVPLDTWFNMTATWDGSNASMYINGSLVSGPTARSWNTVSNVSYVGAQTGGAEYWVGNIAQVLVYDRALTSSEILQNYNVHKARYGL